MEDKSGKSLEILVRVVEEILLPKGFNVTVRERVYNDESIQIAELDVIVTGRLGSTQLNWLIECRDRPSDGPVPGSWIEQLVGRRDRFKFNKVTAVSTTGFSAGAIEYADEAGIEIRSVDEISEQVVSDWFRATEMHVTVSRGDLAGISLFLSPKISEEKKERYLEILGQISMKDEFLTHTGTSSLVSFHDAWQQVLNENKHLFNGIEPEGEPRSAKVMVNYTNPDSRYRIEFEGDRYQVERILFDASLSVEVMDLPIAKIVEYSDVGEGKSISQSIHFDLELEDKSMDIAIHRVAGSSNAFILAHSAREIPSS
jgi:hypothetical protein